MRRLLNLSGIVFFIIFLLVSYNSNYIPGVEIGKNLFSFLISLLKLIPAVLFIVSMFEVWVKKETVIRHMGEESGIKGYLWALILAGMSIGGIYVALPLAFTLHKKGAHLRLIFTYLFASNICRIPMTLYEAGYLGVKFTLIRYLVSLPLIILISKIAGDILEKRNYKLFI